MVYIPSRRYSPLRGLTSSSCGRLGPRFFLPEGPLTLEKSQKILKKHLLSKNPKFLKEKKFQQKEEKSSLFLNIRNMRFDQSSPVQPNPEKKIEKNLENLEKIFFSENLKFFKIFCFAEKRRKNAIFLVLPIEEICL